MAIDPNILKGGDKVRVKSGKVYIVHTAYKTENDPDWVKTYPNGDNVPVLDKTRVRATQWQVNDKYPEGRFYQASRDLKLSEIDLV